MSTVFLLVYMKLTDPRMYQYCDGFFLAFGIVLRTLTCVPAVRFPEGVAWAKLTTKSSLFRISEYFSENEAALNPGSQVHANPLGVDGLHSNQLCAVFK